MNRPSIELAVEFNRVVRGDDEQFDEPDELNRVAQALNFIEALEEPTEAAAVLAYRVTRAQGFAEGNKRTALLLARWVLDHNGVDGTQILPPSDRDFADLLVQAASGIDVQADMISLLASRR